MFKGVHAIILQGDVFFMRNLYKRWTFMKYASPEGRSNKTTTAQLNIYPQETSLLLLKVRRHFQEFDDLRVKIFCVGLCDAFFEEIYMEDVQA